MIRTIDAVKKYKAIGSISRLLLYTILLSLPSQRAFSQIREDPNFIERPPYENKALIDGLIKRITQETRQRTISHINGGESLSFDNLNAIDTPTVKLQDRTIHFLVENCANTEEFNSWNIMFFPLKIDTSSSADVRRSASNLRHLVMKNAYVLTSENASQCVSRLNLPSEAVYKIVGSKNIKSKRREFFEKSSPKILIIIILIALIRLRN